MAKKKKRTYKKKIEEPEQERSTFWPLAGAILLVVAGLFIILGGFGTGGVLPKDLFHGCYWLLGWGAWLTPIAFVTFCVIKFKNDDKKIPLNRVIGMLAFLGLSASWLYVTFATQNASTGLYANGHGGQV